MYSTDLKLRGMLLVDGEPVVCSGCGSGFSLTLDKRGPRETWPAWLSCEGCGHGDDHPVITNGLVEPAIAACPNRRNAKERELFTAEWRDHTIEGERAPEWTPADLIDAAQEWPKVGRRQARRRWRGARRKAAGRLLGVERKAREQVDQMAGGAKSAALSAAWDWQTGGAGPAPKPRGRRCRTKGCRGGWITITTRIHGDSGKAEEIRVPCSTCHRAG